ncbi:pentapeptide repeat-containing protein [Microcoleus sp. D3_18_C4]|uniref:pentapeptide repeat-containing protein n=1 Tax=Microcoleus sp. D3_18_C4 TaxID=3055335 RepID=UPI004040C179
MSHIKNAAGQRLYDSGANLTGARLSFANLSESYSSADLHGAILADYNRIDCQMKLSRMKLQITKEIYQTLKN